MTATNCLIYVAKDPDGELVLWTYGDTEAECWWEVAYIISRDPSADGREDQESAIEQATRLGWRVVPCELVDSERNYAIRREAMDHGMRMAYWWLRRCGTLPAGCDPDVDRIHDEFMRAAPMAGGEP